MTDDQTEVLRQILDELQAGFTSFDTAMQESARIIVDTLTAQNVKAETRHEELVGELRIINNSIINTNIRLDGMDRKLTSIDTNVKRGLERDVESIR
jgi:hypothetical protein